MQVLIKKIRQFAGLSQQEFGEKLGVTFATINRWENGKATPNKLAQTKLYDFCKESSIPVYDMTIQRIQEEANSLEIDEGRIILYHGSKSGIKGKIAPISREKCDFGAGFYMGTEPAQPLTLICDFEKSKFYIVSILLAGLETLEVPADLDWSMIVAYNRGKMERIKGTDMYEKYRHLCENKDVIIGSIANDRMFYVLDNFFLGNITDLALIKSLSALQLGRQYVAVTQKGCDAVRIEKEVAISYLERRFLQDVSEENRAKGIKAANDICKNYRREGEFFDEIMDRAKEVSMGWILLN
jgi:transcriptional regulator with XRE-family HTH domain